MQAPPKPPKTTVASATQARTPLVGIVLSSFAGGKDDYGAVTFDSLPAPKPPSQELSEEQLRQMTLKAIQLGSLHQDSLRRVAGQKDAVVLLVSPHTDPGLVATVMGLLKENQGLTIISEDAKKFPGAVSPSAMEAMQMPAPGIWSRRDVTYRVPKAVLHCDRLISVAPLRIDNRRPSLAVDNYRSLVADSGSPDVTALDLFGFHVADYAVLGGTHIHRDGKAIRHNLVLAGPNPTAVDAVGAAILGLNPQEVPLLQQADRRGFGEPNLNLVWTRGNRIKEALHS